MYYNVDYEICAAVFLILLIAFSAMDKQVADFQSKMFRPYVAASFMNVCLDIATCYGIAYHEVIPIWANILFNTVFLAIQFVIPNLFMQYVYYKVQRVRGQIKPFSRLLSLPTAAGVVMALSSPYTRWIFYFDETGYYHGSLHTYLYINAVFYSVATIVYTLKYSRLLRLRQTLYMIIIVLVAILPTIIQFFLPRIMLSSVGTALAAFIMYLTNENLVTYVDSVTVALNREAFAFHVRDLYMRNASERMFIIALDNFKIVNELYGMDGGNELMRMLVDSLRKKYSDSRVYRFGGDIFVVTLEEADDSDKVLADINEIIRQPYVLRDMEILLSACVCLLYTKNHDREELVGAIEHGVNQVKLMGKGQYFEVGDEAVDDIVRRKSIEQAMMASIRSNHFEVYYQPIYDTEKKGIHSLEALARLNVPGYGYVSPEEFIRISEQNGTIVQIGLLVLEEVCRFIKECDLRAKGIEYVEVNLSVVQCMQEKLSKDVDAILSKYGIEPDMINLEITESAAAYSEDRLVRNMERLSGMNIAFSLDDYGSGYSNINYIVDLPFSIIKIDKYVVWAAMKKRTSRRILENTITMFKDIDLKVVAEGIEDLEMAEVITEMGADYLQGFYFSKPVPKEQLLVYLERIIKITIKP